jgi:hypothetical protein
MKMEKIECGEVKPTRATETRCCEQFAFGFLCGIITCAIGQTIVFYLMMPYV